jgi:hypothetical protein
MGLFKNETAKREDWAIRLTTSTKAAASPPR